MHNPFPEKTKSTENTYLSTGRSTDNVDQTTTDKHSITDEDKSNGQKTLSVIGAVIGFVLLVGVIILSVCVYKKK